MGLVTSAASMAKGIGSFARTAFRAVQNLAGSKSAISGLQSSRLSPELSRTAKALLHAVV